MLYEDCIFKYNARGQRVSKTVIYDVNPASTSDYSYRHDTTYDYDSSGRLIRQYTTQATTYEGGGINVRREFIFLYDESGIIGILYGYNNSTLTPYYFHKNLQGDVIAIYDTNGNKVVEYAYDAWGNFTVVSATNSDLASTNPIRYRGYCYDKETGWYYLNARYYNPQWRRFISPDDTVYLDPENVNGCNLYCYCNNDPVNYCDPSGRSLLLVLGLIGTFGVVAVGAVVGAAYLVGNVIKRILNLAINIGKAIISSFTDPDVASSTLESAPEIASNTQQFFFPSNYPYSSISGAAAGGDSLWDPMVQAFFNESFTGNFN